MSNPQAKEAALALLKGAGASAAKKTSEVPPPPGKDIDYEGEIAESVYKAFKADNKKAFAKALKAYILACRDE